MGTVSVNSLWNFIQSLSLSANERDWLAGKLHESITKNEAQSKPAQKKYFISPRMKKLMGSVTLDPKDIEEDDRLRYILSK